MNFCRDEVSHSSIAFVHAIRLKQILVIPVLKYYSPALSVLEV